MASQASLIVFLISFFATMLITACAIPCLRNRAGQVVQADAPQAHKRKAGTPTMGGAAILAGVLLGHSYATYRMTVGWVEGVGSRYSALAIGPVLSLVAAYALIGIVDDLLTIRPRNGRRGIGAKPKFALQVAAASFFVLFLVWSHNLDSVVRFGSWFSVDFGWTYAPLVVLFVVGMANFVNITDGLDGLAAGLMVILAGTLALTAGVVRGSGVDPVLPSLLVAIAGACAAFLWFNSNPARIFMGDTGSLAMGAAIPALAVAMKMEPLAIIAGMVFILDGLSSALQWAVFKYTRIRAGTGRRIFRMSPIHHHFELSGWPEQLVVVRFWIAGLLFAAIAVLLRLWSLTS